MSVGPGMMKNMTPHPATTIGAGVLYAVAGVFAIMVCALSLPQLGPVAGLGALGGTVTLAYGIRRTRSAALRRVNRHSSAKDTQTWTT